MFFSHNCWSCEDTKKLELIACTLEANLEKLGKQIEDHSLGLKKTEEEIARVRARTAFLSRKIAKRRELIEWLIKEDEE
jgi:hypothetical protein